MKTTITATKPTWVIGADSNVIKSPNGMFINNISNATITHNILDPDRFSDEDLTYFLEKCIKAYTKITGKRILILDKEESDIVE